HDRLDLNLASDSILLHHTNSDSSKSLCASYIISSHGIYSAIALHLVSSYHLVEAFQSLFLESLTQF
ncbi:MAG: hypothetical protein J6S85_16540, partial [Methanobrevibacter sp.]|nr:hypothetical protein [Methanobrevibacter sp.]